MSEFEIPSNRRPEPSVSLPNHVDFTANGRHRRNVIGTSVPGPKSDYVTSVERVQLEGGIRRVK